MFFVWLNLILGCIQDEKEASEVSSPLGSWSGLEKDGMLFPIILNGDAAQNEFDDPAIQRSVQTVHLIVFENNTGTLTSNFVMTNTDESMYEFSYSVPMTIDIEQEPYLLIAYDEEIDEELTLECYQVEAGFLSCTYTSSIEEESGSLNFIREE